MPKPILRTTRRAVLAAAAALAAAPAFAQPAAFPEKTIKFIIPTPPGGNLDALARIVGGELAEAWGQQVVVEPKPGANTILATKAVAQSPADGYTVLFTISGFVQNIALRPEPPYKMNDLAPVSMLASFPIALAANAALPASDLPSLVKLAKSAPGKYTFGSYGMGSGAHLIVAGLNKAPGIAIKPAPYKGKPASFPDLVSGDIGLAYGSVGFYANQLSGGKVKLLAVASPQRLKNFPNVPTFAEAGYSGINLPGWGAMFLPAGTPPAIVDKYVQEIRRIVQMPDVQAKIYAMGFEPVGNSNTEFAKVLQTDMQLWSKIARESNIKLD